MDGVGSVRVLVAAVARDEADGGVPPTLLALGANGAESPSADRDFDLQAGWASRTSPERAVVSRVALGTCVGIHKLAVAQKRRFDRR